MAERVDASVYRSVVDLIREKKWNIFRYPSEFYQVAVLLLLWHAGHFDGKLPNKRLKSASEPIKPSSQAKVHIDKSLMNGILQVVAGRPVVPRSPREFIDLAAYDLLRRCRSSGPFDEIAGVTFREQLMLLLGRRDGGAWYRRIAEHVVQESAKRHPDDKWELRKPELAGPAKLEIMPDGKDYLMEAMIQRLSTGPKLWYKVGSLDK